MLRTVLLVQLAALLAVVSSKSADPSKPHPHQGLLKKYERLPPSKIGLPRLDVSDEELRKLSRLDPGTESARDG